MKCNIEVYQCSFCSYVPALISTTNPPNAHTSQPSSDLYIVECALSLVRAQHIPHERSSCTRCAHARAAQHSQTHARSPIITRATCAASHPCPHHDGVESGWLTKRGRVFIPSPRRISFSISPTSDLLLYFHGGRNAERESQM